MGSTYLEINLKNDTDGQKFEAALADLKSKSKVTYLVFKADPISVEQMKALCALLQTRNWNELEFEFGEMPDKSAQEIADELKKLRAQTHYRVTLNNLIFTNPHALSEHSFYGSFEAVMDNLDEQLATLSMQAVENAQSAYGYVRNEAGAMLTSAWNSLPSMPSLPFSSCMPEEPDASPKTPSSKKKIE